MIERPGWTSSPRRPGCCTGELAWLVGALEWASTGIDVVAIVIMLVGAVRFMLGF